eukprot:gene17724-19496_t
MTTSRPPSSGYTSFVPLTPETKGITSGFSFSKIFDFPWRRNREEQQSKFAQSLQEEKEDPKPTNQQPHVDVKGSDASSNQVTTYNSSAGVTLHLPAPVHVKCKSENSSPTTARKEKGKYRNVKTILRRLSAIAVDKRWHQTSGDFKHDFKQYWMPDEHCKECYECGGKFSTFRRRHHCRICGQIFCSRCCGQEVPGRTVGFTGHIRVCNYCYKIVKAYVEDDLDNSLQALKDDIKSCYDEWNCTDPIGLHPSSNSLSSLRSSTANLYSRDESGLLRVNSTASLPGIIERDMISPLPIPRNPFDAFGVTPQEANDIKQDFLRELWRQITDAKSKLELQSHRFRLKTYTNCFIGHELVDWLLTYGKAANRAQGVAIGQDLLDLGWIESVPATEEDVFKDEYLLYQPGKLAVLDIELQGAISLFGQEEPSSDPLTKGDRDGDVTTNVSGVNDDDDDDETVPFWFRQISSETVETLAETQEPHPNVDTPATNRRFSSSRHLDLDQATMENTEGKGRTVPRELSLQMKLDYFSDESETQVRKEIYDQTNKLSLITHVPPPPLDTYVCVEGHPFATKKRMSKVASTSHLPDDMLRGIVEFPKPSAVHDGGLREPLKDESGEGLARERLSHACNHHLVALLNQLIEQDGLSTEWKDLILPIVTRISEKVVPDARRDDDMDIRRYVWFKKVPVGDVPECQVVSGVVFTKNVVHKKMNSNLTQPRILMLSCAIEYQRVENKLTSIDPVVLQEYEFLKNFTARIVTLRPNIVLVEKTVARVAQDMLRACGITIVHNIKSNVMENISRCTGAVILQSIEQVSRPRLGSCQHFKLQKYNLPDGDKKTLMFFEGCASDLGCSLVLQGADNSTLAKVKSIMKYLIYVAYHLKLETKFLMDEFSLPPKLSQLVPKTSLQRKEKTERRAVFKISEEDDLPEVEGRNEKERGDETEGGEGEEWGSRLAIESQPSDAKSFSKTKQENIVKESKKFLDLLSRVILSSSPYCSYPLPYLLTDEGQTCSCRRFIPDQLYESGRLQEVMSKSPDAEKQPTEPKEKALHPNVIINEPHSFTQPDVVPRFEDRSVKCLLADFRARGGLIDLKTCRHFEGLQQLRRKQVNTKKKNKLETIMNAMSQNEDAYENDTKDEEKDEIIALVRDKKMDCFDPYNHQRIAVLFSSYSSESHNAPKPCISPWAVFMEFYGRNDITLGGFLERYCFRPSYICFSHNCDVPMVNHVRYFAHGDGSLYIHMRNLDSPIPGYDRTILTWSWCKLCKQVTPVVPLSFESWSLSFAKYLELRFYGGQYKRRASAEPCNHSLHHDHYQYFSFANMVASFKIEVRTRDNRTIGMTRDETQFSCTIIQVVYFEPTKPIYILYPEHKMSAPVNSKQYSLVLFSVNLLAIFNADDCHFEFEMPSRRFRSQTEYRPIELYEVIMPTAEVIIGKERGPKEWEDEVGEFCNKTDQVLMQIAERINDLRCVEPFGNFARDVKIKDFQSEFQIERHHFKEFIQCLQMKVDSLLSFHRQEVETENQSSLSSSVENTTSNIISLKLNPSEVSALMTGISNMLIKLKAQLCVIVHNWNSKLQEFVHLEKKREKSTRQLSSSPKSEDFSKYQQSNAPSEIGEMSFAINSVDVNNDVTVRSEETGAIRQTVVQSQQKPTISEVQLTDGTILRQTFIGTQPPKSYVTEKIQEEAAVGVEKSEVYIDKALTGEGIARSEAGSAQQGGLKLDPYRTEQGVNQSDMQSSGIGNGQNMDTGKSVVRVTSPYMVVQSPVREEPLDRKPWSENRTDSEGSNSQSKLIKGNSLEIDGSVRVERGSVSECDVAEPAGKFPIVTSPSERVQSPDSYSSQEHWMVSSRERSDTVINTAEYRDVPKQMDEGQEAFTAVNFDDTASHHSSLFVEDDSDVDVSDLISLQDVLEFADDDRSYLSDGETEPDVGNVDAASDIGLGESAVDYESFVKLFEEGEGETDGGKKSDVVHETSTLSCTDSFSSDEADCKGDRKLEDYFATATAKKKIAKTLKERNALMNEAAEQRHFDSKNSKTADKIERPKLKDFAAEQDLISRTSKFKGHMFANALRDSDTSSTHSSRLSFTDDHFDGELQRIIRSNAKRSLFERLDAHAGIIEPQNQGEPTPISTATEQAGDDGAQLKSPMKSPPVTLGKEKHSDTALFSQTLKRTSFTEGRSLGHRRMQSAPVPLTLASSSQGAASPEDWPSQSPSSPFELVRTLSHSHEQQHQSLSRVRSLSHGSEFIKGQEELNKIAEKICQVDRKDLEMDDPEEIQYDESISNMPATTGSGSKGGSTAEKKSRDGSDAELERNKAKKDKARLSKGTSEADESERESCSSASFNPRSRGHLRQKSLPYRAFNMMESRDADGDLTKSSVLEASNNVTGQKKGTEKMKKIISHLLPGSNFQPVPAPFPPHEHYLLPPGDSVSVVVNEKEPTSIIAYSLSSADYNDKLTALQLLMAGGEEPQSSTKASPLVPKKDSELTGTNANGVVLRRRNKPDLADAKRPRSWAGTSSMAVLVEYPINFEAEAKKDGFDSAVNKEPSVKNRASLAEQYLVSSARFSEDSKEPSELLLESHAGTTDYEDQATDSVGGLLDDDNDDDDDMNSAVDGASGGLKTELPDDKFGKKKADNKSSIDSNIILQFQDTTSKFYCNVYYAEQFRQLRELIFPEGEERYIESLSRCVFWKARGGKSGSSFSKSLDDRFVMKQMSRLEAQSFRDFAPQYFQYMDKALKEQRPTTLAKIFGVYRIGFKNSQTNTTMRQDVLVMENLFYDLKSGTSSPFLATLCLSISVISPIFDLKGSVRSRYVNTSSGKEDVLMDENLLEMICESPLFIRPHSKATLSKAIHNDTEFLSNHSVMDYSLLVGIDEVNFELVVGIIDYIRTYTWDKKLESYVKSTGILGGQGKMPTVVSPAIYRTRFTEAMHRYFLMVPDKWTGFGADLK